MSEGRGLDVVADHRPAFRQERLLLHRSIGHLAPDGGLYVGFLTETEPFYQPHTGKVVRQTGPEGSEEIATGLDSPVHVEVAPDGRLCVAGPAFGANGGEGTIVRIAPGAAAGSGSELMPAAPAC